MFDILAINPGSTSTKIACFEDGNSSFEKSIPFSEEERSAFSSVLEQLDRRFEMVAAALAEANVPIDHFSAVVGRGGLLAPIRSGTYAVNEKMQNDLREARRGSHASNLGGLLALKFSKLSGCPAYIVDPVSVDELSDVARVSGAPEIERTSLVHALNQKAVARKAASLLGKKYEDCRFIVAHLGTGVTLGVHLNGRIVDVSGAKSDGPMSPERAGGLPPDGLIELCFSGRYTEAELRQKLLGGWGLYGYLGTRDLREVIKMAGTDPKARLVLDAFVYKLAKGIGEFATVLDGDFDAIVITGGMAYSKELLEMLLKKISFLGRVEIFPGENELEALALGALRVLRGEEKARSYPDGKELD